MRKFAHSSAFKFFTLMMALVVFSACAFLNGAKQAVENSADQPAVEEPAAEQPAAEEPVDQPPAVEEPAEDTNPPMEEPAQEEPVEEAVLTATTEPTPEPAEAAPAEPLDTARLLPALNMIVLRPEDIKNDYTLVNDREVDNDRIVTQMDWADGRQYNAITGRLNGWNTYMERANPNDYAPISYRTKVEVYETIEGAAKAMSPDWLFIYYQEEFANASVDDSCTIGDDCIYLYKEEVVPGTEDVRVEFHIIYRYRNVVVYAFVIGFEGEAVQDHLVEVADLLLSRLEQYQ